MTQADTPTMTDEQMAAALLAKRNELRAAMDRNTAALALLQHAHRAVDVSEADVQAARNGLMALAVSGRHIVLRFNAS